MTEIVKNERMKKNQTTFWKNWRIKLWKNPKMTKKLEKHKIENEKIWKKNRKWKQKILKISENKKIWKIQKNGKKLGEKQKIEHRKFIEKFKICKRKGFENFENLKKL